MIIEEAKKFVNSCEWVYAKSYSKTFPHFYTTRDRINNDELFEEFLNCLREHSKLKSFYSKQYLYLELDGFEYWEMGRPIKAVQVLNKAQINDAMKYRYPNPTQEEELSLKNKLKQRDIYLYNLLKKENKTERDLSHIKFLLNNERRIHGGGKNIIDHSSLPIKYQ